MKKLKSWFNPQVTKVMEDYNPGREILLEQVNLALFTTNFVKEPSSFEGAINCERKKEQNAWKEAIDKEFNKMTKRGVWEVIDEQNVPNDRRCIKNTWIFGNGLIQSLTGITDISNSKNGRRLVLGI
jgi:phage-related tail protein